MATIPEPKRAVMLDVLTKLASGTAFYSKDEPPNVMITINNSTVNILFPHRTPEEEA